MRKILTLGAGVFAAVFGFRYWQTAQAFMNLRMRFNRLRVDLIRRDFVRLMIFLNVENSSQTDVIFDRVDLNFFLNNRFAGAMKNPYTQIVRRGGANIIALSVDLRHSVVGDEIVNIFLNGTSHPITLSINGRAFFNGLPVAVPDVVVHNFTIDSVTNLF